MLESVQRIPETKRVWQPWRELVSEAKSGMKTVIANAAEMGETIREAGIMETIATVGETGITGIMTATIACFRLACPLMAIRTAFLKALVHGACRLPLAIQCHRCPT